MLNSKMEHSNSIYQRLKLLSQEQLKYDQHKEQLLATDAISEQHTARKTLSNSESGNRIDTFTRFSKVM